MQTGVLIIGEIKANITVINALIYIFFFRFNFIWDVLCMRFDLNGAIITSFSSSSPIHALFCVFFTLTLTAMTKWCIYFGFRWIKRFLECIFVAQKWCQWGTTKLAQSYYSHTHMIYWFYALPLPLHNGIAPIFFYRSTTSINVCQIFLSL